MAKGSVGRLGLVSCCMQLEEHTPANLAPLARKLATYFLHTYCNSEISAPFLSVPIKDRQLSPHSHCKIFFILNFIHHSPIWVIFILNLIHPELLRTELYFQGIFWSVDCRLFYWNKKSANFFFTLVLRSFGLQTQHSFPTNPFPILELQSPSHDVPELHKIRWSPDLEALNLWKGSSGFYRRSHCFHRNWGALIYPTDPFTSLELRNPSHGV